MTVLLTAEAKTDIDLAYEYYYYISPTLADKFLVLLHDKLDRMAETPLVYQVWKPRVHQAVLRIFPYRIFFTLANNHVIVLNVLHASQNPQTWPLGV